MLKSIAAAFLVAAASAHQNLHQFWVNDVSPGYEVGIRRAPSNNPVTDVKSNDIVCNVGGTSGAGVKTVAARAGDTITVQWDQSTHPGPITHFLYGPVNGAAASASGVGAGWFKIDELNYEGGRWANEIMSAKDMKHSFKLPARLASGEYLLRSEMLALHGAQTVEGAQFYIGCAQLKITGPGGSCSPKISLPGAYNAQDPNIYIPNFYFGFDPTTYVAPGGKVATCCRVGRAGEVVVREGDDAVACVRACVRPRTSQAKPGNGRATPEGNPRPKYSHGLFPVAAGMSNGNLAGGRAGSGPPGAAMGWT
ncbi:hypothetical protein DL766_007243 [Monosporascus sp. MC13-8B]|uniref:lytic cellulose monooxygenase (C4-dehydrogenating) n=1 Tax=Monosporascus cannonballus TaxID=155416 RepID=A0ABY0H6A2_9PEZI|nr:hypothetical protein DL762_004951 [Monosporascus cannonballus]RYO90800.1 hypothetical protein DL763_005197 [Monosporascus cannonballus]RYP24637.1 hypothetical protein DL766_007243 [Monosporascus sp. MC13-8B]